MNARQSDDHVIKSVLIFWSVAVLEDGKIVQNRGKKSLIDNLKKHYSNWRRLQLQKTCRSIQNHSSGIMTPILQDPPITGG